MTAPSLITRSLPKPISTSATSVAPERPARVQTPPLVHASGSMLGKPSADSQRCFSAPSGVTGTLMVVLLRDLDRAPAHGIEFGLRMSQSKAGVHHDTE
jgi:hypothetical protein